MTNTDALRHDHTELLDMAEQIVASLKPYGLSEDAGPVSALLSTYMKKLKVHLATEDLGFYPQLISGADPALASLAKTYQDEMLNITTSVLAYSETWNSESGIQANADRFCTETHALLASLRRRIEKENQELYPLVDATSVG